MVSEVLALKIGEGIAKSAQENHIAIKFLTPDAAEAQKTGCCSYGITDKEKRANDKFALF